MKYKNIIKATFLNRINRFTAECKIGNDIEIVHVKNTGRMGELFVPGYEVCLEKSDNINRKTKYDLINVYKNNRLFNVDSQVTNKLFSEAFKEGTISLKGFEKSSLVKSEVKYKNSRFDFFIENDNKKAYVEIKGVNLEEDNIALFPDAPTLRGIKHINELIKLKKKGFDTYLIFIILFKEPDFFTPNPLDDNFTKALNKAKEEGVNILAFDCNVYEKEIKINKKIKVIL